MVKTKTEALDPQSKSLTRDTLAPLNVAQHSKSEVLMGSGSLHANKTYRWFCQNEGICLAIPTFMK